MEEKKEQSVETIREYAVSRLVAFFRHLEKTGLLRKEIASVFIGKVKILEAMAKGEFEIDKAKGLKGQPKGLRQEKEEK